MSFAYFLIRKKNSRKFLGLLIFLTCQLIICCKEEKITSFEINKKLIYNRSCDKLLYSTNESGFFRPYIIERPHESERKRTEITLSIESNVYPGDISEGCGCLALMNENLTDFKFDISIYDLSTKKNLLITKDLEGENHSPIFLDSENLFFLNQGNLTLYNIKSEKLRKYPNQIKFTQLFKGNSEIIFLQDDKSNIWTLNVSNSELQIEWNSEGNFINNRQVKYFNQGFFFIGDHVNGFNSIFKKEFESDSIEIVKSINHDLYLVSNMEYSINKNPYIKNIGLNFLSNIDFLPQNGVIYDVIENNGKLCFLYADLFSPATIYLYNNGSITDIAKQSETNANYSVTIREKEGVNDIMFSPNGKIKDWIIWLHGGPNEQVSARYNPYIEELTENGFGVIALNYPGSTGKGNNSELKGKDEQTIMDIQITSVLKDVKELSKDFLISDFNLIGVSYGSKLGQNLLSSEIKIKKFIDISGIGTNSSILRTPIKKLFIFGEYDYILANKERVELLNRAKDMGENVIILDNEGHFVSNKKNQSIISKEIIRFLNK